MELVFDLAWSRGLNALFDLVVPRVNCVLKYPEHLCSVQKEAKDLSYTGFRVQSFLSNAENRKINDDLVRLRLRKLKDLAYRAEDIVDEFENIALQCKIEEAAPSKFQKIKGQLRVPYSPASSILELGSRINEIREKLGEIFTETHDHLLKVTSGSEGLRPPKRPLASSIVGESILIAREADEGDMFFVSRKRSSRRSIRSWTRGALLGRGSFGTVYEAMTDQGHFFAVKEVSLVDEGRWGQQCIDQLEHEIDLLSQFEHENIVRYLGTDKDETKLYIFLELVTKGSLFSLYQQYHLRDSQVSVYTRQILNGLKYLHDRNVVHRDIKCANIMVDATGSVKLADFGLAKETGELNILKSSKGSAHWMAPEVVNPRKPYGLAADIWSLGCTVLEMLTREIPYSHLEMPAQAIFRIGRGELPPIPSSLSSVAQDFIKECLQVEPDNRPSAADLLNHPFVTMQPPSSTGTVTKDELTYRSTFGNQIKISSFESPKTIFKSRGKQVLQE